MFFVNYERFYGIKSYYNKNSVNTRINEYNAIETVSDNSEEDFENHNKEHNGSSKLLGSLKSKSGNLIAGSAAFIKSGAVSDKINAIGNSIKKSSSAISERFSDSNDSEPLIEIPESESGNIDFVIDKYIEAAGYMPAWKFEKFCNDRLNSDCDSAISKYRIKVFTFYMRDLIPVITKLYKFNFLKLYGLMTDYQDFFTTEEDTVDRNLLLKASLPIINKMVSGGMLNVKGEGFEAVYQSNVVEKPLEEEKLPEKEADVKPEKPIVEYEEEPDYHEEMPYGNEIEESPAPVTVRPRAQARIFVNPERNINSGRLPQVTAYGYEHSENKSVNYRLIVNIIVIIFTLISMIISINFLNKRDTTHKNNYTYNTSNTSENIYETSVSSTILATKANEISNTTIKNTEIQTNIQTVKLPDRKLEFIPIDALSYYSQYEEILREYSNGGDSYLGIERCMLCDLNNDNSAELVLTRENDSIAMIYTIFNNKALWIADGTGSISRGIAICENGVIIQSAAVASEGGTTYKVYNGGESLDTIEYTSWDENGYHHTVGESTTDITEVQLKEIESKYKVISLSTVPISSLGLASSAVNEFKGNYLGTGYIHVDSGGLNLRSKPSTDSEVYVVIPNNAAVTIYSSDTYGWYYAEYGNYKGYVSSEFITFNSGNLYENNNGNENYTGIDSELKLAMDALEQCVDEIVALNEEYGSDFRYSDEFDALYLKFRQLRVDVIEKRDSIEDQLSQSEMENYSILFRSIVSRLHSVYFQ